MKKFTRGYSKVRDSIDDRPKAIMSCFNCMYYGDNDDCERTDVLEFDTVIDGNRVYCTKWVAYTNDNKKKIEKRGREKIE